jgi:hypothetical protein
MPIRARVHTRPQAIHRGGCLSFYSPILALAAILWNAASTLTCSLHGGAHEHHNCAFTDAMDVVSSTFTRTEQVLPLLLMGG